jgi:hypothetical protein
MEKSIVTVMDNLAILSQKKGLQAGMALTILDNLENLLEIEDDQGFEAIARDLEALAFVVTIARDAVADPVYKQVFEETIKFLEKRLR